VQRVPPGCRRIWVLVHKNILLASVTKNNFPADGVVPDRPRYKDSNGKDQIANWVAPAGKQKAGLKPASPLRASPRGGIRQSIAGPKPKPWR
jgi:hypothetical protein